MAASGENGKGNGSQTGAHKGPKINISSKGGILQVGARPVLVKTSASSPPDVNIDTVPRGQSGSFMDNAEINISQDGGNVQVGENSKVVLTGETRDGEEKDVKKDIQDVKARKSNIDNIVHTKRNSSECNDGDEEVLNDLSRDQPRSEEGSNIPHVHGEPFDRFDSRSGPAALSLSHSKPSLDTDAVGLPPSAQREDNHRQRHPDNMVKLGTRRKETKSSHLSSDVQGRKKISGKSEKSNIPSSSVATGTSAQVKSHLNQKQNIPHDPNSPEQSPRQVKQERSFQEADGAGSSQGAVGQKRDQSKTSSSDDGDFDPLSRIKVESARAVNYPGDKELHFCVQERDQYVQIGDCCIIVELNIDDKLVDKIQQQGEFTAELQTGDVMVNLRWGDLEKNVKAYRTSLKVTVVNHLRRLEQEICKELFLQRCEKLIKTAQNIFKKCNSDARIVDVTKGCFQFNFIHLTQESVDLLHSEQSVREIQTFLTDLLVTERIRGLAETDGEILRVTSLRNEFRTVNTPEEMKKYTLLARERVDTTVGAATSQAELKPSEMRYKIQDLGNEVQLIKTMLKSQNDTMQRNTDMFSNQMSELTNLVHSMFEKITQTRTEPEIPESRSSPQEETAPVGAIHEMVPSSTGHPLEIRTQYDPHTQIVPSSTSQETDMTIEEENKWEEIASPESSAQPSELITSDSSTKSVRKEDSAVLWEVLFGQKLLESDVMKDEGYTGIQSTGPSAGASAGVIEEWSDKSGFLYQFGDKINISSIRETVRLAMQEEADQSPRASGIDTVLCLDLSQSMKGIGLQQLKLVVNTYLEGVEENATEQRLEENIAVVTFGESAVIHQNLTNDFNAVKEIVDDLQIQGGCSSLLEALVVSVFLIASKGKSVTVDGFEILPHIVLITDGKVTSPLDESDDIKDVNDDVREMILSVILKMKQCGINYPVTCVPVGDYKDILLHKLAMRTNGRVVPFKEANKLSKYYQFQRIIGNALTFLSEVEAGSISIDDVIGNLIYQQEFDVSDRAHMEKIIQALNKPQPNFIFFDDFYVEEYSELPPLGSRVKRKNKASLLEGTVVGHLSESKVEVIWDSGDPKIYTITKEKTDLIVTEGPRIMKSQELNPPIGTLVKRGVDWRYGDQDGGIGKVGAVINVEPLGLLKVCWGSGNKNFYRFGYEGCRDVIILDVANHKLRYPKDDSDLESDGGITCMYRYFLLSWWCHSSVIL